MTIGTLAQEANVSVETVRYYQRVGLLEEPDLAAKPRRVTGDSFTRAWRTTNAPTTHSR